MQVYRSVIVYQFRLQIKMFIVYCDLVTYSTEDLLDQKYVESQFSLNFKLQSNDSIRRL